MLEFDIDQAVNDINTGAFESNPTESTSPVPTNVINQQPFDPNLNIPYKANGRDVIEPLSTVIQRASMGYNYAQLIQQHKQREAEFEAQRAQVLEQQKKWQDYDNYASQNPEWADFVRSQWENRMSQANQQNSGFASNNSFSNDQQSTANLPPQVATELAELRSFMNQYKQERQNQLMAEQDAALNHEIETVSKEFPDIDLKTTDPMTGESLEQQILRHAHTNGISTFRAAFRDMMFDKLLARGQTQAKEVVAKQIQQQVKNGFIGQSSQSMASQNSHAGVNLSKHSYHSLMDMAASELGL